MKLSCLPGGEALLAHRAGWPLTCTGTVNSNGADTGKTSLRSCGFPGRPRPLTASCPLLEDVGSRSSFGLADLAVFGQARKASWPRHRRNGHRGPWRWKWRSAGLPCGPSCNRGQGSRAGRGAGASAWRSWVSPSRRQAWRAAPRRCPWLLGRAPWPSALPLVGGACRSCRRERPRLRRAGG